MRQLKDDSERNKTKTNPVRYKALFIATSFSFKFDGRKNFLFYGFEQVGSTDKAQAGK
jgi:hypothetical protein